MIPEWRRKHPCTVCEDGYGECLSGLQHGLQCCATCYHPGRWLPHPYTDAEMAEITKGGSMIKLGDEIQFRRSGDWTMVYLNGSLVSSGDHYHADEWLQEYARVVVVEDEAGICIPDGHHPIKSLAEVEELESRTAAKASAVAACRTRAAELLAEADALEGKAS